MADLERLINQHEQLGDEMRQLDFVIRTAMDNLQPVAMVIDRSDIPPDLQRALAEYLGGTWGLAGVCQEGIGSKGKELWMRIRLQIAESRAKWSEWTDSLTDIHAKLRRRSHLAEDRAVKLKGKVPIQSQIKRVQYMRNMVRDGHLNSQFGEALKELPAVMPDASRVSDLSSYLSNLQRHFKAAKSIRDDRVHEYLTEVSAEVFKTQDIVFQILTRQAKTVKPGSRMQFRQYDQICRSPEYPGDWAVFYLCKLKSGSGNQLDQYRVTDVVGAPSEPKQPPVDKTAAAMDADECLQVLKGVESVLPYFEVIDRVVDDIIAQAKVIDKQGDLLMLHAADAQWSDSQRAEVYRWVRETQRMIELTYRPYQLVGNHISKTLMGAISYVERSLDNLGD